MKYLVLFDIDGTILQMRSGMSRKLFGKILEEIFEREVPESALPHFAGMTDLSILREIADNLSYPFEEVQLKLEQIQDKMKYFFTEYCTKEHIIILPGVHHLIKKLHENSDILLGLLTGNFKSNAYLKLQAHGLEKYFPFGAFGDDKENRNDLPPIAMERANEFTGGNYYSSKNTVIIGDTLNDIKCARANGIPVISVATGIVSFDLLKENNPDIIFHDFAELDAVHDSIINIFENISHK